MAGKKNDGFNTPFKGLKLGDKQQELPADKAKAPARAPSAPAKNAKPASVSEEERMFALAMSGVAPIDAKGGSSNPRPKAGPPVFAQVRAQMRDEEAEALAELAQLVTGMGDFEVGGNSERIEGGSGKPDPRLLKALREGEFPLQGTLDLHGKTRDEAKREVENFLVEKRKSGARCVLIVTGRGLHSENQIPVLKEQLNLWLRAGRVAKSVLAFTSARPQDGGAGALYVLLRK